MKGERSGNDDTCEIEECLANEASETPSDPDREWFCLGAILDVVSHPMRRKVLEHLASCESEVSLDELAGKIEQPYAITGPLQGEIDRRQHVEMQLYHAHLPKCEDQDLITFDQSNRTVSLTRQGSEVVDRLP